MKNITIYLVALILMALPFSAYAAKSFGIVATVNKDAISESDVLDRMRLIFASTGVRNNKSNREKAYTQALNSLIDEQLQMQEADRQDLHVRDEEAVVGFEAMASQNSMTGEQFDVVIKQQGIPKATLLRKIKAQIAWRNVIGKIIRPQIDVTEKDVTARLDRLKDNIGKAEYKAAEIFLPVTKTSKEAETKALANKLISEMKTRNAPFNMIAAQFSKSSSAKQGGSLGWVQEGELPQELDVVLKSLSKKQVSPPIRGLSGFYILTLLDKRVVSEDTLPSEEDILNAIGLERLDRLQQRYMSDIRSAAFIDRRTDK